MSNHISDGQTSPKFRCFLCTGAVLGGALLGFPAVIASTIVGGLAGGILGAYS